MNFEFSYFHIILHFIIPLIVAYLFFKKMWVKAFFIMAATILVDLDHLLADPIYDPDRCSIGFHILHTYWAIGVYALMLLIPNLTVRLISIGLLIHMALDFLDCYI